MGPKKWRKLSPKVKSAWFIKGIFAVVVLLLFFGLPFYFVLSPMRFILGSLIFATLLLVMIVTWIVLFYNRYNYLINSEGVEIRRGILWKKDVTIPFERIQNVDIDRGPIEQLIGIYKVNIFTAGTGSFSSSTLSSGMFGSEGYLPGVENAEEIKNQILLRVLELDDDGLGVKKRKTDLTERQLMIKILEELKKIREKIE